MRRSLFCGMWKSHADSAVCRNSASQFGGKLEFFSAEVEFSGVSFLVGCVCEGERGCSEWLHDGASLAPFSIWMLHDGRIMIEQTNIRHEYRSREISAAPGYCSGELLVLSSRVEWTDRMERQTVDSHLRDRNRRQRPRNGPLTQFNE